MNVHLEGIVALGGTGGTRRTRSRHKTEIVLAALLTTARIEDIAANTGIPRRTIYRYLNDEDFKRSFNEAKMRILDGAIVKLRNYAGEAVDTLYAIMKDQYAPYAARVASARSIIEFAVETGQVQDLEAKLHELEGRTIEAFIESGKQLESDNHDNHQWTSGQEWKATGKVWPPQ
jgi:hypothetical protein